MVFQTNLLDPVFSPLLRLPPLVSLFILALLVSLIITLVYKYMTDQTLMKDVKLRQKEIQKKMKAVRKEPDKAMKLQKEAMELNMKYMKQSFKPTLITFLPIILIFGWMNANLAYEPLLPGHDFSVTLVFDDSASGDVSISVPDGVKVVSSPKAEIKDGVAQFVLNAEAGDYLLVFDHDGLSYDKELSVTSEQRYAPVVKVFKDKSKPLRQIVLSNKKLIPLPVSENHIGWLGTYILFSIFLSMGLRKLLKIY